MHTNNIEHMHLGEYEAMFRAVNNAALVSVTDAKGDIIYANDMFVQISKYTRDELLGQNHRILKSGDQPQELFDTLWKTISAGNVWRGELKNRAKDGEFYWVDTSIAPIIGFDGKPEKYISVRFLVTKKRQSELQLSDQNKEMMALLKDLQFERDKYRNQVIETRKFQLAAEASGEHIVITDPDGTVFFANKAAEKLTGYSSEEILGTKAGVLWGGNMGKEFYRNMWHTIKVEKKVFEGELSNRRKNGEEYITYATISPVLNEKKDVLFFVGTERDITKEHAVDRAKTEFVSLASDQLRTPLTAINWYCELLQSKESGLLNEKQIQYVAEIAKGSKRMADLVTSLLNVSRIELGTFQVDPEPTDLVILARSAMDEIKPISDEKKLTIKESHTCHPIICVDPKLFRMVYQNLLSNALKYTTDGGNITISHIENADSVQIEVADNGYGIPEYQQDKIFSKLFRADNAREMDTQGTGLGLYIIKSIIEEAGGNIRFKSILNKGTTFFISIPKSGMQKKEGSKPLE